MKEYIDYYDNYSHDRKVNPKLREYETFSASWKCSILLRLIPNENIRSVLEFGCGSGDIIKNLLPALPNCERIYGLDISKTMLELAKSEVPQAIFLQGDQYDLDSLKCKVDLLLAIDILEHVPNPQHACRSLSKLSKYVLVKMPLEKSLIAKFQRKLSLTKHNIGLEKHPSGHLFEWNQSEALTILESGGLQPKKIILALPPKELRYHAAFMQESRSLRRRVLRKIVKAIEIFSARHLKGIHGQLFNSWSLFVLCVPKNQHGEKRP